MHVPFLAVPVETELYDVLGVPTTASEGEIKRAYRKKAKDLHPDKNPDDPTAIENFQEMAAAYEILSDPDSREAYDNFGLGDTTGRGPGGGGGAAMDDFFNDLFGGGGGGGGGMKFGFDFGPGGPGGGFGRRKAHDEVIPYEVTLEDLYNGKSVKMNMEKDVECGVCKGSGARGSAKPRKCVSCEGKGWTFVQLSLGPGRIGTSRAQCRECDGRGEKLREKDRCKKCKGERVVKEKVRQEIFIEKGMVEGQRIVLHGAGDQEPGLPPGDVIFLLKAQPHASFDRSGNDLLTTVQVTLSEALLGFDRILINHLDGRGIKVASPRSKTIKPCQTIVLRGEGMPTHKNPDVRGNLYVVLEIEMPSEQWMQTIDLTALQALLPPKRVDADPQPEIVDTAGYEESDMVDFGDDENAWEDEDDEDGQGEPECRTQ